MTSEQLAWLIRRHGVEMTALSGGSHIGAILSVADIMGVLYTDILKFDKDNPEWDGRDRFILSKGHSGASVYAAINDRSRILHSYIVPGYDFLHTQDKDYILEDIEDVMREQGVSL